MSNCNIYNTENRKIIEAILNDIEKLNERQINDFITKIVSMKDNHKLVEYSFSIIPTLKNTLVQNQLLSKFSSFCINNNSYKDILLNFIQFLTHISYISSNSFSGLQEKNLERANYEYIRQQLFHLRQFQKKVFESMTGTDSTKNIDNIGLYFAKRIILEELPFDYVQHNDFSNFH